MSAALPRPARLHRVTDEAPGTRTYELDLSLDALPGQFVMVWAPGTDERPYTLLSGDPVRFTVSGQSGPAPYLATRQPGDAVHLRGPFGTPYPVAMDRPLLLARGHGLAAMLFLARTLGPAGQEGATLLIATKPGAPIAYEAERADLADLPIVAGSDDEILALARERLGQHGSFASAAAERLTAALLPDLVARGMPGWAGVERTMKCGGMGLCGACEIDGILTCCEGPVLPVERLATLPSFGRTWRDATASLRPL